MSKLSREQMMESLGTVGEKLTSNYFTKAGFKVETSPFKYDKEKDMIIDGINVEVKTQAPFSKLDAFTFNPSQLYKCTSVGCLIFVAAPHPTFRHYADGWIYQAIPGEFKHYNYNDKKGNPRIVIPIKQDALKPLFQVTPEEAAELTRYVYTEYKNARII